MPHESLVKEQKIKSFFTQAQITSKILQHHLELYFSRIEQYLLVITNIQAEILCQKEQVDPIFNTTIIEAQKSYDNIIQDQLVKTIESAQQVHDVTGAFGFVLGLLSDSVRITMKTAEIEQQISTYLTQQEDEAPLIQKEGLEKRLKEIEACEQAIDAIFTTTARIIASPGQDIKATDMAEDMIREIHYNSLKFSTNIKIATRETIQTIEDCINKKPLAIENKLPLQLMGNHLIRGTKSASVQTSHPLAYLKSKIAHAHRKKQAREAYQNYLPVLLATIALRRPSSLEIKCLTAVPKRYPEADFNAQSRNYPQLMKHLQITIYLIRKSSRTLCENVHLLSPLLLCEVDKKAFNDVTLNQHFPLQNRLFSRSPYKDNKHLMIRDTLISLWRMATEFPDEAIKSTHLTTLRTTCFFIIDFYIKNLTQEFLTHPLFAPWKDRNNAKGQKKLLELIIQIINKELSDNTPSDYYTAPLCGVSQFCSALDKRGTIYLELNEDVKPTLNFTGFLSQTKNIIKRSIGPLPMLDRLPIDTRVLSAPFSTQSYV